MRTRPKLLFVIGVLLVLSLLLAACSSEPPTPPPSQFTNNNSDGETAPEPGSETTEESQGENPAENEFGVAEDIPIPEGAYDANISSSGRQIVYKVAGRADQVVDFYVQRLPEFGWQMAGQDTVIGNTALMVREKDSGDRLSINMQFNPNAEFTVVTLVVTRN